MSKLDDLIEAKNYELQVLQAYRDIVNSGSCNTCASRKNCSIRPDLGQLVRYNCSEYVDKERCVCGYNCSEYAEKERGE